MSVNVPVPRVIGALNFNGFFVYFDDMSDFELIVSGGINNPIAYTYRVFQFVIHLIGSMRNKTNPHFALMNNYRKIGTFIFSCHF